MAGLALIAGTAACFEEPPDMTSPDPPGSTAALVSVSAGDGQSANVDTQVAIAPAVIVTSASGAPVAGVTVRFIVVQGGGIVSNPTATTDAQGIASAGTWKLGSLPGLNEVDAQVGSLPLVQFTATGIQPPPVPPVSTGSYNITIRWIASGSARQQQAVVNAAARWQSIITSDLGSVPMSAPANACFTGQPAINETIDDVLIYVELVSIDGVGKILGESGPCYIRTEDGLPVVGHLRLDTADLQQMEQNGTLDDVVVHEMGHILGIGTLWTNANLLTGAGTQDPEFTGTGAVSAFNTLGGVGTSVPVENTGADGTRDGHWRESVFGNELMTGYISGTPNPISALTIASLQDMGYGANKSAAATYVLGGSSRNLSRGPGLDLRHHERVFKPKFKVDRRGRKN